MATPPLWFIARLMPPQYPRIQRAYSRGEVRQFRHGLLASPSWVAGGRGRIHARGQSTRDVV
jgi:hypothetical protein